VLKLILINIRNTVILLAIAYFSIPIVTAAWSSLGPTFFPEVAKRARLVNYQNTPWAEQHFREFDEVESGYLGYVAWRRKPYTGRTITIDVTERIRVTPHIPGLSERPTYFFGGSTMWGTGSNDEGTIPAYYQEMAKETAVNYGESGWTAHQSLNQLTKVMAEGRRPVNVVFYDGANEVVHKCRRENSFFSHSNEQRIQDALEYEPTDVGYYLRPVLAAARDVGEEIFDRERDGQKFFDCDTNPEKAALIAEALIDDWAIAKYTAETKGARFFAFLQPVAFLSRTRVSHLKLDAELAKQFETVYPLIRAKMKERGIGLDISGILDGDEYFYIDFCHVSPNGNRVIAEGMRKAMTTPTQVSGR
jgi:hypothetical protein